MAAALQGADAAMTRYTDAWGVNAVLGNDATFVDDVRALLGSDPSNATVLATLACALALAAAPRAGAASRNVDCRLDYQLTGWSLVYKHTTGNGRVSCDNGQSVPVRASAKAVGLTAGDSRPRSMQASVSQNTIARSGKK